MITMQTIVRIIDINDPNEYLYALKHKDFWEENGWSLYTNTGASGFWTLKKDITTREYITKEDIDEDE